MGFFCFVGFIGFFFVFFVFFVFLGFLGFFWFKPRENDRFKRPERRARDVPIVLIARFKPGD
jgi:hypothetical protein